MLASKLSDSRAICLTCCRTLMPPSVFRPGRQVPPETGDRESTQARTAPKLWGGHDPPGSENWIPCPLAAAEHPSKARPRSLKEGPYAPQGVPGMLRHGRKSCAAQESVMSRSFTLNVAMSPDR